MFKKLLILFFVLTTKQLFSQKTDLAFSSNNTSNVTVKEESIASARHQAIVNLKKTLNQQIVVNGADLALKNGEITTDVFTRYLNDLDKSYLQKLQALNEDTKSYQLNYIERSVANRFHSKIKSLECLNQTNNKDFVRLKDTEGDEIVAFPIETLKSNTRYGLVDGYQQGFARIKKDQVYGFVNQCGEEVIPAQFEYAEPFNDGKALVKKFIWYFIDAEGNESAELEGIVDAKALNYGISMVKLKNNKYTLINNDFDDTKKPICPMFDQIEPFNIGKNLYRVRNGKMFGLIRINGIQVLDLVYDKIIPSELEQYIVVEKAKKIGLMTLDGGVKVNTLYDEIAGVVTNQTVSKTAMPIITKDPNGFKVMDLASEKTSAVYTSINNFNAFGLAKSCLDRGGKIKCGYINYEGSEVIPVQYDEVFDFTRYGLVVARNKFENCSILNGPCQADMIFDKMGAIVKDKTSPSNPLSIKYVITDTLFNKTLITVKTTYTNEIKPANEGFHLIDKTNNSFITAIPYTQIKRFNDDLITVMNDDKWGVLDLTGRVIIKPLYKEILNESEGMFGVKFDNNKLGYVDRKGKVQITFEYSEIQAFKNGLAIVAKNAKFGIITKFNAKIAPCVFKEISPMPGGNFELVDNSNVKYILNSNGDCQTNCAKFDDIRKKANN
jgi:WG containing repeat